MVLVWAMFGLGKHPLGWRYRFLVRFCLPVRSSSHNKNHLAGLVNFFLRLFLVA